MENKRDYGFVLGLAGIVVPVVAWLIWPPLVYVIAAVLGLLMLYCLFHLIAEILRRLT